MDKKGMAVWGLLGMVVLGVAVIFVYFAVVKPKISYSSGVITDQAEGILLQHYSCPDDVRMSDYLSRMRTFSPTDSPISEPCFAVKLFKQYLSCKHPKSGTSPFTPEEIEQFDPEMLGCGKSAYLNCIEQTKEKKVEAKGYEADEEYYDQLLKDYTKEEEIWFDKVYTGSAYPQTMCNAQATGRT